MRRISVSGIVLLAAVSDLLLLINSIVGAIIFLFSFSLLFISLYVLFIMTFLIVIRDLYYNRISYGLFNSRALGSDLLFDVWNLAGNIEKLILYIAVCVGSILIYIAQNHFYRERIQHKKIAIYIIVLMIFIIPAMPLISEVRFNISSIIMTIILIPARIGGLASELYDLVLGAALPSAAGGAPDLLRTLFLVLTQVLLSAIWASVLADLLVLFGGVSFNRAFREMAVRSLRMPRVTVGLRSTAITIGTLRYILRPVVWAILKGILAMICIAAISLGLSILYLRSSALWAHPAWLSTLGAFGSHLPGSFAHPALFLLLVIPAITVALVGIVVQTLRGGQRTLLLEWLIFSIIYLIVARVIISRIDINHQNYVRYSLLFLLAYVIVLCALTVRSILWSGLMEATIRWRDARQGPADVGRIAAARPVLYLRAFIDDAFSLKGRLSPINFAMGHPTGRQRFETLVAQRVFNWRPVVALGNPHLPWQLHGAIKHAASDENWQNEVYYWHRHAAYTLMIVNKTRNISWEVDNLLKVDASYLRTIYVITDVSKAVSFFSTYGILALDGAGTDLRHALVVYWSTAHGWTVVRSIRRSYSAYSIAIDIAVAAMEAQYRPTPSQPLSAPFVP